MIHFFRMQNLECFEFDMNCYSLWTNLSFPLKLDFSSESSGFLFLVHAGQF